MSLYLNAARRFMGILGIKTTTQWRKMMALRYLDPKGLGLEIGPSIRPLAPRCEGFNVKILDFLDRDGLIEKYAKLGVNQDRIEEVDFVWKGENYPELVGGINIFDWVISSHSIEHVPDMIEFLKNCRDVLKVGGVLSLAIPNKRNTFDHLREISSIGTVIDAHLRQDIQPTLGTVVDFELNFARKMGKEVWSKCSPIRFAKSEKINAPKAVANHYRELLKSPTYQDVHVWTFTPESFIQIMKNLNDVEILTGLEMIAPPVARKDEFLVSYRRIA
jgi:SAM-dependent methyltransferase